MKKKAQLSIGVRGAMFGLMGTSALLTVYGLKAKISLGSSVYEGTERIEGKTAIITGANSGIGKQTSAELLRRGGRLIMACRDLEKCEEARNEIMQMTSNRNVVCRKLDLASFASIRKFAEEINAGEERVDLLVNNAGVMGMKKRIESEDGIEMHSAVNYFGPFLLTHLLLDKLKANAPSRIVNVVSPMYKKGYINFSDLNSKQSYSPSQAYGCSKVALVSFNLKMAELLDGLGVTTYAAMPGVTDTNLKRHQLDNPRSQLISRVTRWFHKSPESGSQTVLYCALSSEISDESGFIYRECQREENEGYVNRKLPRERLYVTSLVWTGLKDTEEAEKDLEQIKQNAKS